MDPFNVCINNFTYRRYSFEYFLSSVKRLGLHQIELSGCHPHFTQYEAENFDVKKLAGLINDMGIKVAALEPEQNFLPVNIAASQEYFRRKSVEQLKFYIRSAKEFDCDKVIIYPGKGAMDHTFSETRRYACDSIAELAETAKSNGVTLLIQNVSNCISNLTPNRWMLKELIDRVSSDNLGLSVNTSAAAAAKETLDDYFELFGNRIKLIQLSDSDEDDEQLVLGEGNQDIRSHVKTMEKYHFDGPISLEIVAEEYAYKPEENYLRSLRALRTICEKEE
ncbi:MAG: sugar phosphate isomerase/epimerase [Clostridiales bacterium]|nr:sugar phosphate isomerase/epimerase [Clostridiales bacterium]